MKISYHRRRKIKTRRIAIRDLILRGIEDPKDLAKELKVTLPTIKRDLEALKTMSDEDLTFETRQTSQEILDKKDMILKMLDDENYYNENGDLNEDNLKALFVKNKTNYVVLDSEKTSMILSTTNVMLSEFTNFKLQLVIIESNDTLDFEEISLKRLS